MFLFVHYSLALFWREVISFLPVLTKLFFNRIAGALYLCREERLESDSGIDFESMYPGLDL